MSEWERDHTCDKSTTFGSARVVALRAGGAGVGGAPCVETRYSGRPVGSGEWWRLWRAGVAAARRRCGGCIWRAERRGGAALPPGWRHSYTTTSAAVAVPVFFTRRTHEHTHAHSPTRRPAFHSNPHMRTRTHVHTRKRRVCARRRLARLSHPSVSYRSSDISFCCCRRSNIRSEQKSLYYYCRCC